MHVMHVVRRQQRRHMQIDFGHRGQRRQQVRFAAGAQRAHRGVEHLRVQIEPHFLQVAALRFTEYLARAADLEVVHRKIEPAAEFVEGLDCIQALFGILGHAAFIGNQQIGIRLVMRAADPAAQLMQLRQAELVGAVRFDDGRA